jgi:sulfur carrier protein
MKGFMEINGKHATLPEGTTILDYLERNHYVLAQIAVEHNYVILDREDYAKVVLKDDDILEIVSFMGGGC